MVKVSFGAYIAMEQENVSVYQRIVMTLQSTLTTAHVNAYILAKLVREINQIQIQVSGTMSTENVCVFQTRLPILMDVMESQLPLMARN